MKIQSFSDLITNSSSEVFLQTTYNAEENLRKFIDAVLSTIESEYTCNDLFGIENTGSRLRIYPALDKDKAVIMEDCINNLFYAEG